MDCKSGPAVTLNSTSITKRMFSPLHAPVPFVSFHSFRALPGLFPSGGVNHVQDRFPCIPCCRKQRFHSSQGALVTLSAIRARNLSASLFFVFTEGRQKMFSGIKTPFPSCGEFPQPIHAYPNPPEEWLNSKSDSVHLDLREWMEKHPRLNIEGARGFLEALLIPGAQRCPAAAGMDHHVKDGKFRDSHI